MADAAEPHAQVFINAGMSADFTAAMRTAADLLVQSLTDKSDSKSKVRTATSALKTKLRHGRKAVKVIDAMIKSALAGNKDLLEGWKLAKRVPQTRGSAAAKAATPATPSAPTSAAA
ncbi:MAG: hypothetical protein JWM95_2348 [Gemmatimonadetes bacterium]|nr:hypothetical protein [Gemmatimonadota bacterium]